MTNKKAKELKKGDVILYSGKKFLVMKDLSMEKAPLSESDYENRKLKTIYWTTLKCLETGITRESGFKPYTVLAVA